MPQLDDVKRWLRDYESEGRARHPVSLLNVEDITSPVHLGDNHIAFPVGWDDGQMLGWRCMMGLPPIPESMYTAAARNMPDWHGDYLAGKAREQQRWRRRQCWRWLFWMD